MNLPGVIVAMDILKWDTLLRLVHSLGFPVLGSPWP